MGASRSGRRSGVMRSTTTKASGERITGPSLKTMVETLFSRREISALIRHQSSSRSSWLAGGFLRWMRRGSANESHLLSATNA